MGYSLVYTTSYLSSSKGPKKMRGWGEVGKVFSNGYVKKVRCFGAGGRGGGGWWMGFGMKMERPCGKTFEFTIGSPGVRYLDEQMQGLFCSSS